MPSAPGLELRPPRPEDRAQVEAAQAELAADGFDFTLRGPGETWQQWLARVERDREGIALAPGRAPATMLLAVVGDDIVGRVHIRHRLTEVLLQRAGISGTASARYTAVAATPPRCSARA